MFAESSGFALNQIDLSLVKQEKSDEILIQNKTSIKSTITHNLAKIKERLGFIKPEPEDGNKTLENGKENSENTHKNSSESTNLQQQQNIKQEQEVSFEIDLEPQILNDNKSLSNWPHIRECKVVLQDLKDEIKAEKLRQKMPFSCGFCDRRFTLSSSLKLHLRIKHKFGQIGKFECDFDGKIFNKKDALVGHMIFHRLNVNCEVCRQEMKFASLKGHMKSVHSDERNYKCKICSKSFKNPSILKNHLRSHDKKFECNKCGKKVRNGQDLKFHIKQFHENPRSFKCEICEKGFYDKGNLKKHLKTHDKNREKAYKCERCSFSSDNKAHFKLHQDFHKRWDAKIAGIKNPIKCAICSFMFKSRTHLNEHVKRVHPIVSFQCDLCGKFSKTKSNFEKHIRVVHLKNKKLNRDFYLI